MIKAILIDDEPLARFVLQENLQRFPDVTVVQECGDGFEAAKAIQQHQPQLVFLDVQMPKLTGFELLELLEHPPAIIFTTAFDEFAIKAFEANAIDYLLKPFSEERFDKAMSKFLQNTPQRQPQAALLKEAAFPEQSQRIVVKSGGKIKIIPVADILYIEAADDYVKIVTNEGGYLKNKTMGYFEKTLDATVFVRTHRSYILNVQQITRIEPYEKESYMGILKSSAQVPVSRAGYQKLKAVLGI